VNKWLIIASMIWVNAVGAPVYTWTDADGQVHYSDRPVPGAKEVELQTYTPAAAPATTAQAQSAATPRSPAAPSPGYTAFNVISPAQQETLWNLEGTLNVQLDLEPALQKGHRIGVYLDGKLIDLDSSSLQFTLPEVYRGIHSLQAVVLDGNGMEVLRSLAVTFMVQQTSVLNPNNPNARPPVVPPAGG
jgi:Domain of unknown function (DUF4124)